MKYGPFQKQLIDDDMAELYVEKFDFLCSLWHRGVLRHDSDNRDLNFYRCHRQLGDIEP